MTRIFKLLMPYVQRLNDWIECQAVDAINEGETDRDMFDVVLMTREARRYLQEKKRLL